MMLAGEAAIDYEVRGEGPALLMIGGLGFGRWGWFKQVPALSRHFRTITFDVHSEGGSGRGVGEMAAEAASLLDHLGIEKAHVLGVSLGGFVAQRLALDRPDLVDRLVLVSTSYGGRGPSTMSPAAMGRMFGWGAWSAGSAARRGLEAATSGAYRKSHPEEFEKIVRWRLSDSPSLSDYYGQAMAGARFDARREVGRIAVPALVIHGKEDNYVPVANAAALAEAIPNARLLVLDDAGHLVFIERAETVNREVAAFLSPNGARQQATGPKVGKERSAGRSLPTLLKNGAKRMLAGLSRRL